MLWFINNIKELKKENEELQNSLADAQTAINTLTALYIALEARVTALDGGPPPPEP